MEISLVVNRIAFFKIAIADRATKVEKTVAGELQLYMKKATGAEAEIVQESNAEGTVIYVGHTEYAKKNGISGRSKENWIIKAVDGNIVLTGGLDANDRGVAYSVYHFLEDYLDVHWWNYFEEYVPDTPNFRVSGDIYDNKSPAVPYRKIQELFTHKDFVCQARNRMNIIGDDGVPDGALNESAKVRGGAICMGPPHPNHTFELYFPANEYFDKHPDWWAFNEGLNQRIDFGQLCLSNESLYQAMLDKLLTNIEEQNRKCEETGTEKPYFYSVSFADRQYMCECPSCKETIKKAGRSGYLLKFVNRLAKDVAKLHSDVMLETLAYSKYMETPLDATAPEANVIIRYADLRQDMLHDLDYPTNVDSLRRIQNWVALCKKNNSPLFIWDYLPHFYPNCPMPQVFRIIDNVKKTYAMGVSGYLVENEIEHIRDFWALEQWVLNRIIEDPTLDGSVLIDTFMTRYYGKASEYVKEYLMLAHRVAEESGFVIMLDEPITNWGYATVELVEKGMEILTKALHAVEGDKVLERRVRTVLGGVLKVIAARYYELKKTKEAAGDGTFEFDRKTIVDEIIFGLKEQMEAYAYAPDGGIAHPAVVKMVNREIKLFTELAEKSDEKYPLPAELVGIDPVNIEDVHAKDIIRFFDGEAGESIVKDQDAQVDKVLKLSRDAMNANYKPRYRVTEKDDPTPQPLSFFVKKKNKVEDEFAYKLDVYKRDLVADQYHLYKLEGVKGITPKSNLVLYLIHQRDLAVNVSAICKIMPFEECDIYVSMKVTGEYYGGSPDDDNALYFERIIIVKTK